MALLVRPAREDDLAALSRMDLTYPTGRYLELSRDGASPEMTFSLRWRDRDSGEAVAYADYSEPGFREAREQADLFLVAEADSRPAGLLMIIVPPWTDAAEITDLAVDRPIRRRGAGRALVEAAAGWARERGHRALWVEPGADNAEAILFYVAMGFRLAGFNDRMYSNADTDPGRTTLFMYLELR